MSYAEAMAREKARLAAAQRRNYEHASAHGEAAHDVDSAWDHVFEAKRKEAPPSEAEASRQRKLAKKLERRAAKTAHQNENAAQWSVYVSGIPPDISYTAVHSLFSRVGEVGAAFCLREREVCGALRARSRLLWFVPRVSAARFCRACLPRASAVCFCRVLLPRVSSRPHVAISFPISRFPCALVFFPTSPPHKVRKVKLYKDESGHQKGDGIVIFGAEDPPNPPPNPPLNPLPHPNPP